MVKGLIAALGVQSLMLFIGMFSVSVPDSIDTNENSTEYSSVQIVIPKPQTSELKVEGYGSNPSSAGGALQNAGPVLKNTDPNASNLQSPEGSQTIQPNAGQSSF